MSFEVKFDSKHYKVINYNLLIKIKDFDFYTNEKFYRKNHKNMEQEDEIQAI